MASRHKALQEEQKAQATEEEAMREQLQAVVQETQEEVAPFEPPPPAPEPVVVSGFLTVTALKDVAWVRMGQTNYTFKAGKDLEMLESHAHELAQVGLVKIVG